MARKLKIAFGCIFYPFMIGRYILEALLRRKDVEVWTYGPFTNTWIPWAGGMHIDSRYVFTPDFPMVYDPHAPTINYKMIEKHVPFKPDLWLEANAGIYSHERPNEKYAIIGTDPHVLQHVYEYVRPKADWFFGMQKPYLVPGDIWLPYAYDPIWHAPSAIPMNERNNDVALLGLQYPNRNILMHGLQNHGLKVVYRLGYIYDEALAIYQDTRIGINWSSLQDTTARCFELMAMGCVPVLNRVPDLMEMFVDGQEFLGFDTASEAHARVIQMLADPDGCERCSRQAKKAVEPHTWDARIEQVLKQTGVLK